MNLLYFTHEKEYGGSSRALVALLKEIKEDYSNKIYVVVPFKNAKIIKELKKLNVEIIVTFYSWWQIPINTSKLKRILFRMAYVFNFFSKIVLIKKIRKLNIDIIHSNSSVIDIGAKIANKLKIPHIWHFREFKEKNLKFIKSDEKSYKYIEEFGGNIIYISKAIEDFYKTKINTNKSVLIYDGVSEDFFEKNKTYKDKYDDIKFLLAGTLQKSKGQDLAVEAIGVLKQSGYHNMKLYLAGGDSLNFSKYLNQLINKYNIQENVEYLGFVSEMKNLRKNVDVELLCSESEAFGLVTVEAMLAGNLMIGSNSGATTEIIQDGETGVLYQCGDKFDLANKMKLVLKNTNMIKEIGLNGQKYAIEHFSSKKNAKIVINYYKNILKE